ncbi:DUF7284 family protein [Halostagnicola kamekurae]|uniref:Uncharacterized protein n=1 Tax=Halostagnicola kamekurae TaxID=619731 RepID=A0A1I6RNI8_9EURY|nr:hypothetical protein [Halostagnicola kamekurae]SFS66224.1 hypothetical protein SAMN04488556_1937 [Halostagnicola kamekurae]
MYRSTDRGVSTVVDITLALLVVSASVLVLGSALYGPDESPPEGHPEQALESMSATTSTVVYDLAEPNETGVSTIGSDTFDPPGNRDTTVSDDLYEMTTYGSSISLLADAALANVGFDESDFFAYGAVYEDAVDSSIRGSHVGTAGPHIGTEGSDGGTADNVYAVATWTPYEGSSLSGTATTGQRPPPTADVSSVSTTVSSDVPALDPETLAREFEREETSDIGTPLADDDGADGYDAAATVIAEAIVEGYFPLEETQYALESSLTERSVAVYEYRQVADSVGVDVDDYVGERAPHAAAANETLVGEIDSGDGLSARIAADMRNGPIGGEIDRIWAESSSDTVVDRLEKVFERIVSPETVDVTVQTWEQ